MAIQPHKFLFNVTLLLISFANLAKANPLPRGEYIFRASGGCSCHINQEGETALRGGRPMKTPFGVFYSTNITPDKTTGIGTWTLGDFKNSMTHGVRPDGSHLYPVFPYTSFAKMNSQDLEDLGRYVMTRPAVEQENIAPDVPFPMRWRGGVWFWKQLFFRGTKSLQAEKTKSEAWNRGAYLVNAVSHCAECHSPRNILGALKSTQFLAGTEKGPDGDPVPNITPHTSAIGDWSEDDIVSYLKTGAIPDGDYAGGLMAELIDQGYKYLTDEDAKSIAVYLKSLAPLPGSVKARKPKKNDDLSGFE